MRENKYEKKFLFKNFLFFKFFCIQIVFNPIISTDCSKDKPILKEGTCVYYCEKEEFNNNICTINNEIIKTQWLNNIILLGEENFTYINYANYSNGDMIIELTSSRTSNKILVFGLNIEGGPFFKGNNFYKSLDINNNQNNIGRVLVNSFIENINNVQYLVNIEQGDFYTRIYDLKNSNKELSKASSKTFLKYKPSNNPGFSTNYIYGNKNIVLFGFYDTNIYARLSKINIISTDISNFNSILKSESFPLCTDNSVSCFVTDLNKNIICLAMIQILTIYYGRITAFDQDFNEIEKDLLTGVYSEKNSFLKGIHFKEDSGVFIYYYYHSSLFSTSLYPKIVFKRYNGKSIVNHFTNIDEIDLDKKSFNYYYLLNDIIKISDNKICFISTSNNRDELYIVLINIFDTNNLAIRYYSVGINNLYKFKFFSEIKLHLYKKFISFAFNFCTRGNCKNQLTDPHNTALMMISYANGTDFNLNITDYLSKNNDQLDNIIINLKENIIIENNIFGHVYSGIKIKSINNCNKYYFISTKTNNTININYILEENENLLLRFSSNSENIISKCQLGYSYIITEPDYQEYNKYIIERVVYNRNNDKEETVFNNLKIEYEGRTIYYNIFDKVCDDINCELCQENDVSICIKCKSNYNIQKDENGKNKYCILDDENSINDTNEKMNNEQLKEFFDQIKENVLNTEFNGENQIIEKQNSNYNFICQISTLEDQKNNNNENASSIDIGECEDILREKYSLPKNQSLLVIKTDVRNENFTIIYVQYEIYHPITKIKLNMDYCKNIKIAIHVPVDLDDYTISLYESLTQYGYNLFDSGDSFYNDICATYTSENGTDMLLEDRKKEIFTLSGNISMCQIGCDFESYNKTTKKAKCNCEVQINSTETDATKLDFSKKDIASNFLKTLKNSNFLVLKCYKLCFKNFIKNKGQIIMTIIYVSFLTLLVLYFVKDRKAISAYIYGIVNHKLKSAEIEKNPIKIEEGEKKKVSKKKKVLKKKKKKNIQKKNSSIIMNNINSIINKDIITTKNLNNFNEINEANDITNINKKFENNTINENGNNNNNEIIDEENKSKENEKNNSDNKDNSENNKNEEYNANNEIINNNNDNSNQNKEIQENDKNDGGGDSKNQNKEMQENDKNDYNNDSNNQNKEIQENNKNDNNNDSSNQNKEMQENDKNDNDNEIQNNDNNSNQNNENNNDLNENEKCGPPQKRRKNYKILNTNSRNSKVKNLNTINSCQNVDLLSKSNQNLNNINMNLFPSFNRKIEGVIQESKKNETKINNNVEIYKKKTLNANKEIKPIDIINKENFQNLNDQELNTLEYEAALIYDKRNYLQYYWSLLKKKQLILFTFYPANDYNLFSLKLSLFLLSFSLYFTINGFFFSDETMHKIHEDKGQYNLLFQIPQILYSSVISVIINYLLRMLSLSEKNILFLKKEKNSNEAIENGKAIEKCIIIKFIIFFILSNLFLLFFWYFISCFCAVYTNTQNILIKDTLVSFAISMAYPFGINLLPGILRLPALKAKNKDRKILYKISGFVALI